nr:hypothetical protein [uncultured Treponema sp.]
MQHLPGGYAKNGAAFCVGVQDGTLLAFNEGETNKNMKANS